MGTKQEHMPPGAVLVVALVWHLTLLFGVHQHQQNLERLESCLSRPTYQVCEKP